MLIAVSESPFRTHWRRILDLADRLRTIRSRLADPREAPDRLPRLKEEARAARVSLEDLLKQDAASGALARVLPAREANGATLVTLALLFREQLSEGPEGRSGRQLLDTLHETSYEKLGDIDTLGPDGLLRSLGLVRAVLPAGGGSDPLDAMFTIAPAVFERLADMLAREASTGGSVEGYEAADDHLLDMKAVSGLCERRSLALFAELEGLGDLGPGADPDVLTRRIGNRLDVIAARLGATATGSEQFPLVRLQKQFHLGVDESLILVHLLFRELRRGEGHATANEMVQLVSTGDSDLLGKRALLGREAPLVASGLVVLEDATTGTRLVTHVSLAPWAVRALLGEEFNDSIVHGPRLE